LFKVFGHEVSNKINSIIGINKKSEFSASFFYFCSMIFIYNLFIKVISGLFWFASLFNAKARLFVSGRKALLNKIKINFATNQSPVLWIHCASLGEFEQGRPIIEAFKKEYPTYKVLLTFFSPSGYEVRKNYALADWVHYLPWDTKKNAISLIEAVKPTLVIFVKYEFWFHYSNELNKRSIPILSVASIFREEQLFFKPYGGFYRSILEKFSYFFVQNAVSKDLLKQINISNVAVAGDTRFDRVNAIANGAEPLQVALSFKNNTKLMVVGSAWPEDMEVLSPFINEQGAKLKFIIAPHEISESSLKQIESQLLQKSIRYSQSSAMDLSQFNVLIIDNIGLLSRLYRYGEFAFVGGAYGKGLHNILEAACYGIPIFFGNKNLEKFQEAKDLINRGGAFDVADYSDLLTKYEQVNTPENFMLACEVTRSYVLENLGATDKIMKYCRSKITV
jgi:3-deoxy-D-manno-octulosonic-acid transferase